MAGTNVWYQFFCLDWKEAKCEKPWIYWVFGWFIYEVPLSEPINSIFGIELKITWFFWRKNRIEIFKTERSYFAIWTTDLNGSLPNEWNPIMNPAPDWNSSLWMIPNRQNRNLFKIAVELSMIVKILGNIRGYSENDFERMRGNCVKEVKRLNGSIRVEDGDKEWQESL